MFYLPLDATNTERIRFFYCFRNRGILVGRYRNRCCCCCCCCNYYYCCSGKYHRSVPARKNGTQTLTLGVRLASYPATIASATVRRETDTDPKKRPGRLRRSLSVGARKTHRGVFFFVFRSASAPGETTNERTKDRTNERTNKRNELCPDSGAACMRLILTEMEVAAAHDSIVGANLENFFVLSFHRNR